jgi:hypothetical protein
MELYLTKFHENQQPHHHQQHQHLPESVFKLNNHEHKQQLFCLECAAYTLADSGTLSTYKGRVAAALQSALRQLLLEPQLRTNLERVSPRLVQVLVPALLQFGGGGGGGGGGGVGRGGISSAIIDCCAPLCSCDAGYRALIAQIMVQQGTTPNIPLIAERVELSWLLITLVQSPQLSSVKQAIAQDDDMLTTVAKGFVCTRSARVRAAIAALFRALATACDTSRLAELVANDSHFAEGVCAALMTAAALPTSSLTGGVNNDTNLTKCHEELLHFLCALAAKQQRHHPHEQPSSPALVAFFQSPKLYAALKVRLLASNNVAAVRGACSLVTICAQEQLMQATDTDIPEV